VNPARRRLRRAPTRPPLPRHGPGANPPRPRRGPGANPPRPRRGPAAAPFSDGIGQI